MDVLGAMVAAAPVVRAADLGTKTQNKQGVLAGSIGQASKKSQPEGPSNQQIKTGRPWTSKMLRTILLPEEMPENGKVMDALSVMIAAMPVVSNSGLGTL